MMLIIVLSCILVILLIFALRSFGKVSVELKKNSLWLIVLCLVLLAISILFQFLGG
ncbi:hypothetical protein [Thermotoga caldifontis]|uniref:hypothetical protein n=1 Tax=Thermotoga caldifontis TaxID=1508419 RepID=UPI000B1609FA|nr:hypothetical protein [Thermotoga caldifontis]